MTDREALDKAQNELETSSYLAEVTLNKGLQKVHQNRIAWLARVLRLARKALYDQEARKNPRRLSIEELRQMDTQPVYVVPLNPGKDDGAEWCVMWNDEACIPGCDHWAWAIKDYGKTWIAYRHKPKEE